MQRFRGITTALVTPLTFDGKIDLDAMARHAERQIDAGVQGLLANGSTGEAYLLSQREQEELISCVIDTAQKRVPVMVGVSHFSLAHMEKLLGFAARAGADAILTTCPPYLKPQQHALRDFFQSLAAASELPICIYDHPGRTGSSLTLETLAELLGSEKIFAVKDATGLPERVAHLKKMTRSYLHLGGNDDIADQSYREGADGLISATANIAPKAFVDHYDAAASPTTQPAAARQDLMRQTELWARLAFIEANPVAIKYILHRLHGLNPTVRQPYAPLHQESRAWIDAQLKSQELF